MKKHLFQREQFCALLFCFVGFLTFYGYNYQAGEAAQLSTFCNPLNLPYRFLWNPCHGERRPTASTGAVGRFRGGNLRRHDDRLSFSNSSLQSRYANY